MTDPDSSADGERWAGEHKAKAIDLCVCLCDLFGESLDRITLWDRIASGLATAAAKSSGGDLDQYVSLSLEHVKADPAAAARHTLLRELLADFASRPAAWRQGFVRWTATRGFALIAHARTRWEQVKSERRLEHE